MATGDKSISSGRVEQLAKVMTNAKDRLEKKLGQNIRLAEKYQLETKALESELKILQSDFEVAFGTKEFKVSLLHKRVGAASYIKGRCWWRGKQREVQIGSIPSVLERINNMISQGECGDLKTVENGDLSWEELRSNEALIEAVKTIGRARLREYIIKKLLTEHLDGNDKVPGPITSGHDSDHDVSIHPNAMEANEADWYVQWRRENL